MAVSPLWYLCWHKKDYVTVEGKDIPRTIAYLKEEYQITNWKLTVQGFLLLGCIIGLFNPAFCTYRCRWPLDLHRQYSLHRHHAV